MNEWLTEHMGIAYLIIFVLIAYVYNKVFRVRKLPLLKEAVVYVLIALGSLMLLIFQIDASLPIIQSLLIAVAMMALYRIRVWQLGRKKGESVQKHTNENSKEG